MSASTRRCSSSSGASLGRANPNGRAPLAMAAEPTFEVITCRVQGRAWQAAVSLVLMSGIEWGIHWRPGGGLPQLEAHGEAYLKKQFNLVYPR